MTGGFTLDRRMLMAGGGAALLAACEARPTNILRSNDTHPYGYPTVEAVEELGRQLSRLTDGRLSVKVYAGGQLGSERDTLEITTFGGLDMNRVNLAPLNSIEKMTIVPSLPFLFRSQEHLRQAMDGAPGEVILNSLEPHGLIGLCFYDSGARSFYNTKQPINSPDDMKGMKIRVQNSDLYVSMIRALGADATPMSLGEVYQSLVQGVIDGAENNWPSYDSGRHYEAAPYYSLTGHVMAPEILVMSVARWEALKPSDREAVREAARLSVPYMRERWDKRVSASREKLLSEGVQANEIPDLAPFVEAMRPVWNQFLTTEDQRQLVTQIEEMAP
ncbi:TRAP transporter substrate-binding protein [Parvularcula marina]|uniref:TRAP transporter substrate-binding protein n=1 Tax=Parvularcula marina TaxID=2292771 RepID=UPI003515BCD7